MMKSSNPALQENTFPKYGFRAETTEPMTINGVVIKTAICLLIVILSAGYTWMKFVQSGGQSTSVSILMRVGGLGGIVIALVTVFKQEWAPVTTLFYALFEGLFIGGISAILEASFPGIVIQAAGLTFGTLGSMLFLYQTGIIKATERFKIGVMAATGGIRLLRKLYF
jgi:uncharacterized YccA/Bax inhibitor family protein